jgi:fermentation-respiration switch protein FrsA (DUF1100 family)
VLRPLLNALLFFPTRAIAATPRVPYSDLTIDTEDGERLHGWWVRATKPALAHALYLHGNGGNIGDRAWHVERLAAAGLDVLIFDYRGYGRSSGRPSEDGTYRDASAALAALLAQPAVDPGRVIYLGESLGGAVALELASRSPPAGLILQSTFTSIRDMARLHYPFVPRRLVPDAYPSLRLIPRVRTRLLCVHGDRDEIVPLIYGEALFEAARCEKELVVLRGARHNDPPGAEWAAAIARFAER